MKSKRPRLSEVDFEEIVTPTKRKRVSLTDTLPIPHKVKKHRPDDLPEGITLNRREIDFCHQFHICYHRTEAAIKAGYNPMNADEIGWKLLQRADVRLYLEQLERQQEARIQVTADDALREAYKIVTADVNSIQEYRRVPCRYCWGENNEYQRTQQELDRDLRAWNMGKKGYAWDLIGAPKTYAGLMSLTYTAWRRGKADLPFDPMGGSGYTIQKPVNSECTADPCFGEGIPRPFIRDSRFLDSSGRALYEGFEISKGEVKIRIKDKSAALNMLYRRFGLDKKAITEFDPDLMSDDELNAVLTTAIRNQIIDHED